MQFALSISAEKEPSTYRQANKDPRWIKAMTNKISVLEQNNTWILTDLPKDKTIIDCKWVYKIKHNSDESVERFKARPLACGFMQVEGLDYQETFAPVAKMTSVCCVLAISAARGLDIYQLDVNNAFLHGILEEAVCMKLPPGFYQAEKNQGNVCRLIKTRYGLKQASHQFAMFSSALHEFGFQQSANDHSLFTLTGGAEFIILLLYVDNVILTGTSTAIISEISTFIHSKFQIKDLSVLKYFFHLMIFSCTKGNTLFNFLKTLYFLNVNQ